MAIHSNQPAARRGYAARPAPVAVLVVDDSRAMRTVLTDILSSDDGIEVVGTAVDPYDAREKIKQLNPDVVTLDIEMPRMDGISFLRNLMRLHPMPVVMISTFTQRDSDVTLDALELGAIDVVAKPRFATAAGLQRSADEIITKVKAAATANIAALDHQFNRRSRDLRVTPACESKMYASQAGSRIIAIGASTGGTEAIKWILGRLGSDCPGIVIAQHIPHNFSRVFAERLNRYSALSVRECKDGQEILAGNAYVAPGGQHLTIVGEGGAYRCRLSDDEPVNRHRPSVDVLFRSVAHHARSKAVGVILTGMGKDGAQGLKEMRDAGAMTIAQDESTSVVWGMPGTAAALGAVDRVVPLEGIVEAIMAGPDQAPA